jgi:hypothetical protein
MAILRAMDGKFYDLPDADAAKYEVPREKVKELLEKAGGPAPQGGPGPGPGGGHGGPPSASGGPVVVQIFAGGQPGPSGAPPHQHQPQHQQGGEGDVDPYWWWRNFSYWPNWPNWGNY